MMNKQRQGHQLTHSLTFNSNFSLLLTFYEGVSQSDQKFKTKVVWEINWAYLGKPWPGQSGSDEGSQLNIEGGFEIQIQLKFQL